MKKKLLFMLTYMNVGGTEKAMLNMLDIISQEEYDVTLLLLENKGGFMEYIPEWVNVQILQNYAQLKPMIMDPPLKIAKSEIKKGHLIDGAGIAFWHLVCKLTGDRTGYYHFILRNQPELAGEYNVAIAYAGPMDFITSFVLEKIQAKKKVQWIHFDVSKCGFNVNYAKHVYPYFDKIYVVSDAARNVLTDLLPEIKSKTETMHNVVSKELCQRQAEEGIGFTDDFSGTRILTVGRLSEEKGQEIIPEIVTELLKSGCKNFRWYLVGSGKLEEMLKTEIAKREIGDHLILLGTQLNPYPFYRECDLYVQTSRHEGYCITIAEARVFDKFVISTDVAGARDQIKSEQDGKICGFGINDVKEAIEKKLQ